MQNTTSNEKPYLISPDGFAFNPNGEKITIEQVTERYKQQGYYSTVKNGQRIIIPLNELKNHCMWHDEPYKF